MEQVTPGQVYWARTKSDIDHPHVIVRVVGSLVEVCQISTNQSKVGQPGNVILEAGDGGLNKKSIVDASKLTQISIDSLGEKIGMLSGEQLDQVKAGVEFVNKLRRD